MEQVQPKKKKSFLIKRVVKPLYKTIKKNITLIILGSVTLFFCWLSLYLFILKDNKTFFDSGAIGDAFAGLTTPIINFLSVILIYLSFRQQYKANKIQKKALSKEIKRNNALKEMGQILDLLKDVREEFSKIKMIYDQNVDEFEKLFNITDIYLDNRNYSMLIDHISDSFALLHFIVEKTSGCNFKIRDEEVIYEKICIIYNENIKDIVFNIVTIAEDFPKENHFNKTKNNIVSFQNEIDEYIKYFENELVKIKSGDIPEPI